MGAMGVDPYWTVTFDTEGSADAEQRDRLILGAAGAGITDLIVFAHGWNNDLTTAVRVYRRFFTPFPALLERRRPAATVGYAGVFWPSLRFLEEPLVDYRPSVLAEQAANLAIQRGVDKDTLDGLVKLFPARAQEVRRMAALLRERPASPDRLADFFELARRFAPEARLAMLTGDAERICEEFAAALESTGAETVPLAREGSADAPSFRRWSGAREVLRQLAYYRMCQQADVMGESGLAALLDQLADVASDVRIHLLGHGLGARLVLAGLRAATSSAASVTLLQGTFPPGTLRGAPRRVNGPLVVCHSRYDDGLGTLYPLAWRASGSTGGPAAVGYEGIPSADDAVRLTLADTSPRAGRRFPESGLVSVDASSVVRRGYPPMGAHMDICHADLARVVLLAGRIPH
ncbi:alpha/beta hydrolase [Streptantibioticus ferralitis]